MDAHRTTDEAEALPSPQDFGLSESTLEQEIRKDTTYAWYFENGRLTPGVGSGLLAMALMIALGAMTSTSSAIVLDCLAIPVGIVTGVLVNRIVRRALRHDERFRAYIRARFAHRLCSNEVDRASTPLSQISRPWRTGGVFRRDDDSKTIRRNRWLLERMSVTAQVPAPRSWRRR